MATEDALRRAACWRRLRDWCTTCRAFSLSCAVLPCRWIALAWAAITRSMRLGFKC